jgi:uncharacterized protein YjiS (DUF1127 family)
MNAYASKVEASLLLATPATPAADRVDAIRLAAAQARDVALARGARGMLARAADAVLGFGERARLRDELGRLTDRDLADIGLTRADIPAVIAGRIRRV